MARFTKKDVVFLTLLFMIALWMWTSPIKHSDLPFGEGDAAWHFSIGDYISSTDRTITRLPNYIGLWYYGWNQKLGINALEYPPSNHVNYALMQVGGGHRFIPIYIYKAIVSFIGAFFVYFLLRKLFGFYAAALASFCMIFSLREAMTYLWGQQPTLISFTLIPAAIYCSYMFFRENKKVVYLYMLALVFCSQFLLHIQGLVISILVILPYLIYRIIKERGLPFVKSHIKHYIILILIVLMLCLPFLSLYTGASPTMNRLEDRSAAYSRIFKWGVTKEQIGLSYPEQFILFSGSYTKFGWIFVTLGIVMLLLRRKEQDMVVLSWIIGFYFVLHLDLLGFSQGRVARMAISEPQLMFSLISVGLVFLVNMIFKNKKLFKIGVYVLFLIFVIFLLGKPIYTTLNTSYQNIQRITPVQYKAALWMKDNIPEDSILMNKGTFTIAKKRFMHVISNRYIAELSEKGWKKRNMTPDDVSYMIIDYSDLAYLQNYPEFQQQVKDLNLYEASNLSGANLIYNNDNIHIYKLK